MHRPHTRIERDKADINNVVLEQKHRVSECTIVHRFTVSCQHLEELAMQVHRMQPDRVVGEPHLGEDVWFDLLGFEDGKGVTIDRPSAAGQGQLVFDVDINVDSLDPLRYPTITRCRKVRRIDRTTVDDNGYESDRPGAEILDDLKGARCVRHRDVDVDPGAGRDERCISRPRFAHVHAVDGNDLGWRIDEPQGVRPGHRGVHESQTNTFTGSGG